MQDFIISSPLILEIILLFHVLVCVRSLVHVVNKIFKREFINRKVLIVFYIFIFYNYCDMSETILRKKLDEYEFIMRHKALQQKRAVPSLQKSSEIQQRTKYYNNEENLSIK